MTDEARIRYVPHANIDKRKWDSCIGAASNSLIYACSWWLDAMAKNWDALVLNDYEAVMPLTWNKKAGISYLYQPPLTPQLGIFSIYPVISPALISAFLLSIPRHFKFAEIFLNYGNALPSLRKHTNYILSLSCPYHELRSRYKKSLLRNIKRAESLELRYGKSFDLKKALDLYKENYRHTTPHVKEADYQRFEKVCLLAQKHNEIIVRNTTDKDGRLLAVSVLLHQNNRLYLLESTTLKEGRDLEANHFLLDQVIREFAGTDTILDFDGSDIPGIAYFYRTFGGVNQPSFFYRINKLPWLIKWTKPEGILIE